MWLRCGKSLCYIETSRKFSKSPWVFQTSSFSDIPHKKSKIAPLQERRMIDRTRIWAKGGDGGSGCNSFRRSRNDHHGRPDGGNGGRGGDVILECSPTVWDFSSLQHHINAKRGGHGTSKNKIGSRGEDKVVRVPVGTVIHVVEGEIPSKVEKKISSSVALDPWDIPGTLLDDSPLESILQQPVSSNTTGIEVVDKTTRSPSMAYNSSYASSPSRKECRVRMEDCNSWEEESGGAIEAMESDDGDVSSDIYDSEWEEEEEDDDHIQYDVAELTEAGQQIIVACGGEGGFGNVSKGSKSHKLLKHGAQTSEDVDDVHEQFCSTGFPGSEVVLMVELKSIADVGFVGMPNAGKSTLLGAMSRAKPTVGHYAFTTLRPNLGNLNYDDLSITVADIPGLIKGAHENRGLGHAFLRHIERTKVLAYVLDLAAALDGKKGTPPWEQLKDLMLELEYYREGLSVRPSLVVANKIDEAGAEEVYEELKRRVPGVAIFPVCAVLEDGVPALKAALKKLVNGEELQSVSFDGIVLD